MEGGKYELLFRNVMEGNWDQVFADYEDPEKQKNKRSKDTVLHIAVLNWEKDKHVLELVKKIRDTDAEEVLGAQNENGNTPLHLAAGLGNEEMCRLMAEKCPTVISIQNAKGETPLFVSVLFDNANVFECLLGVYSTRIQGDAYPLCRKRTNGDTIFHAAIKAQYFGLAYKIIKKYPKMANTYNMDGQTPLHVLADKPHAFESGSSPQLFDKIIYNCATVSEPKETEPKDPSIRSSRYPQNYDTCMTICEWSLYQFQVLLSQKTLSTRSKDRNDEESQQQNNKTSDRSGSGSTPSGEQGELQTSTAESNDPRNLKPENASNEQANYAKEKRPYPPNYETMVNFFRSTIRLLLVILGLGMLRIPKIKKEKEQHSRAFLLMNELIDKDDYYNSEGDGMEPSPGTDDTESSLIADANPHHRSDYAGLSSNLWDTFRNEKTKQDALAELTTKFWEYTKHVVTESVSQCLEPYHNAVPDLNESRKNPSQDLKLEKRDKKKSRKFETAFLVATRTGVTEIVRAILRKHPVAIRDEDSDGKNVVLLAVEHRQINIYNDLWKNEKILKERVFRKLDNEGNSALHLAAKYGGRLPRFNISGDALQMQCEMKWFKFVKGSMPQHFIAEKNNDGQTPGQILKETHKELVQKGGEWLTKTSESCSVVSALIAGVAFATAATVPGGNDQQGFPNLKDRHLFHVFAILSLVALCSSVSSVVLFLTILTSRFQEKDFAMDLPRKLLLGLTTLFLSIAAILLSFCAGHFFLLQESLKHAVYPIYVVALLPVTYFGLAQLNLYIDLIKSVVVKMPQPSYTV